MAFSEECRCRGKGETGVWGIRDLKEEHKEVLLQDCVDFGGGSNRDVMKSHTHTQAYTHKHIPTYQFMYYW